MSDQALTPSLPAPPRVPEALLRSLRQAWPTYLVAAIIYGGFVALTLAAQTIPLWLLLPALTVLLSWHSSLQHECSHGHPTRRWRLDLVLGWLSLGLWLPFIRYRDVHLAHHRDHHLTCPLEDPESWYVTAAEWRAMGPLGRGLRWTLQTLAGRMVLGPAVTVIGYWRSELRLLLAGDRRLWRIWATHALGAAAVILWVTQVAGLPLWLFLLGAVYPAIGLSLIRSFAEHRAVARPEERSAMVRSRGPLALLFLNNNLHVVHHRHPGLPWFRLPRAAHRPGLADDAAAGAGLYDGYRSIFRRYLLAPIDHPVHPSQR